MNQSSAVVLPMLTEQKTIMWVCSEQIGQQVFDTAELQEAFDTFPYLRSEETAALAQRCSMHPDQVKVWFMAQRLRYGISWDHEDIHNVREMLMPSGSRKSKEGEEKEDVATKTTRKRRVKKPIGKEDKSKGSSEKKQDTVKQTEKDPLQTRKRKMKAINDQDLNSDTSSMTNRLTGLLENMNLSSTSKNTLETSDLEDKPKTEAALEKEITDKKDGFDIADAPSTSVQQPKSGSHSPLTAHNTKTFKRLVKMRTAFLQCQYPDTKQYSQLAEDIGVSRKLLVQWFNNVRCYIKKARPLWMNTKQHRQAVATVRYRQYMTTLQSYHSFSGDAQEDQKLKSRRK